MSFSIIICTYNPNIELLTRLLTAIKEFKHGNIDFEVIIVDNCSSPPIDSHQLIKQFIEEVKYVKLLHESRQGLTYSRLTGLKNAIYDWVVLFDDDNEPAKDYLVQAKFLIKSNPHVAAWGPGLLSVQYLHVIENPFLKKIKWLFQERNYQDIHIDNNITEGSVYYPFGTGMIVKKECFIQYSKFVNSGQYTMTDRKGDSLHSAGDIQILYTCLQMGYYAGSSNTLILNHIIEAKKTCKRYVYKLVYALNSSQLKAYREVFTNLNLTNTSVSNLLTLKTLLASIYTYRAYRHTHTYKMYLSKRMGELNARVQALNLQAPYILRLFEAFLINE